MKPISGLPDDVISDVIEAVRDVLDDVNVEKFCIGITNDAERRRSELDADGIVSLYRTYRPKNSKDIEVSLIEIFGKDPKFSKKAKHEDGELSPDEVHYVYIAVWLKI